MLFSEARDCPCAYVTRKITNVFLCDSDIKNYRVEDIVRCFYTKHGTARVRM